MTEVNEILDHIKNGNSFLLSGGAGSGKTFTLVQVIKKVLSEYPTSNIACMTFTNAAVKEIEERVKHNNLNVTTIHDFFWDNIKHFQKELKASLVELANDGDVEKINIEENKVSYNYFDDIQDGIQYKEYLRIREGIISHDEVIMLAEHMFMSYPKLCDIVKDKFPFIFIDEYQDTHKEVVKIFLKHFKDTNKYNQIGFFGDAMQSIYDDRIGDLSGYKDEVQEVKKEQNRRNPDSIIQLANKLRIDGLVQEPAQDPKAPNNNDDGSIKQGEIKFLYSTNGNLEAVRSYLGWDFDDPKKTKELNLTHNLIAGRANFKTLLDIYSNDKVLAYVKRIKDFIKDNKVDEDFSDKTFNQVINKLKKDYGEDNKLLPTKAQKNFIDKYPHLYQEAMNTNYNEILKIYVEKDHLLDDKKQDEEDESKKGRKRDKLIQHLFKIQENIWLYQNGYYNDFLRATDFRFYLNSVKQKRLLKERIDNLTNIGEKTIGKVIAEANDYGICQIGDKLNDFINQKKYIYNQVQKVPFREFQYLYEFLEGRTPFSTQHKTKGTEFDNVLIILDNGNWNNYRFEYLFTERTDKESILNRTKKLFYTCCTRAKERLAVYYKSPTEDVISKANKWFGKDNVIDLSK